MAVFYDPDFQKQLVAYLCRDRQFLRKVSVMLSPKDFKPRRDESQELYLIATTALEHWQKYGKPIGGLLRFEMLDVCREKKIVGKVKDKVLDTVEWIRKTDELAAVAALEERVLEFKKRKAKSDAVEELIDLKERGKLTDEAFSEVVSKATAKMQGQFTVTDYFGTLDERIERRSHESSMVFPYLMIDPLDEAIRTVPRGSLSMFLAKWKVGKSVAFVWLALAMAFQGYNVLYVTLEDPKSEVENRLDASLTNLPVRELHQMSKKLKKRFRRMKSIISGRIKIVDGTTGGITVPKIRDIFEQERNKGFTADVIIIDYDDEIVAIKERKGESSRRMEFGDIYRDMRQLASRLDVWMWTAGQARRGKEDQEIVKGEDSAEDISKIRKVALCIGVGAGPKSWGKNARTLFVAAHKFDDQYLRFNIMGDFKKTMFYDREATLKKMQLEDQDDDDE